MVGFDKDWADERGKQRERLVSMLTFQVLEDMSSMLTCVSRDVGVPR